MIKTFRSKALKLFYEKGDVSKIQSHHISKIRLILTRLEAISVPEEMNQPGANFHSLTGEYEGFWSVKVDKNYRIIFRMEGEAVQDIDYLDYH
jgi:proteic killer suppression protein